VKSIMPAAQAFMDRVHAFEAEVARTHGGRKNITGLVASRLAPRKGQLGGIEYYCHGIGVRLRFPDGAIIETDYSSSGVPCFDAWRIKVFLDSTGLDSPSSEFSEIAEMLRAEEVVGTLRELEGQYAMAV
jgi:hypothetical protein